MPKVKKQTFNEFIKKCNKSPCDKKDITCEECCWNNGKINGKEELKASLREYIKALKINSLDSKALELVEIRLDCKED